MRRQTTVIVVMWIAALGAAAILWMSRRGEEEIAPALGAPGQPVRVQESVSPPPPVATPASDAAPTTFRGDNRHTGRSSVTGPSEAVLAWSFETGARISSQPVVDRAGRIYVASHDRYLHALDENGRERWKADLLDRVYSTPAIDDEGNVYVGSDVDVLWSFSPDGTLRWRFDARGDADTGVTIAGGLVIFGADRSMWALRTDGTVAWRFDAGGKIYSTPAADSEGNVYFGSQDDHFYALAPDGTLRWRYRTGGDNDASPAIGDDGTVYFGSDDHHLYAMTPEGTLKWSTDLDGMVRAPVGLGRDGSVLVGVFGPRPRVVSLDATDGELRWFFPVTVSDTTEIGVASGPLVDAEGNIYFGAHDDYLYSLAPTGELRWAFATDGDVDSSPILLPTGMLLFASDDHRLYALRPTGL